MDSPTVDELLIADDSGTWRAAGFDVDGDLCEVGSVRLRLEAPGGGRGIVAWSVRGARSLELDGLATTASGEPLAAGGTHPNGVVSIDHVVVISPRLDRTAAALERTAATLGDLLGEPRPAVQPGRRIATLRREAGLGPAVAFMTPGPGAITVR
jgi:hypothetical protein